MVCVKGVYEYFVIWCYVFKVVMVFIIFVLGI